MIRDLLITLRNVVAAILLATAIGITAGFLLASTMNGGIVW